MRSAVRRVGSAALSSFIAALMVAAPSAPVAWAGAPGQCRVVDVAFTPTDKLQIAAWLEDGTGHYIQTVYITDQTGRYGLGNRPGVRSFNSSPKWPYGRREMVLPVWAHRHGQSFPGVEFQNNDDKNLSHPFTNSSPEVHYCRPFRPDEPGFDTGTCASNAYTDKGVFSTTGRTSLYPPRADLVRDKTVDSVSVAMYAAMDPFDAVSQATPVGGAQAQVSWPIPTDLPAGSYTLYVETSKESDFNTSFTQAMAADAAVYGPPAGIPWSEYGVPWRGQPSVVYQVPFTIGTSATTALAASFAGYGDPDGQDGTLRVPDGSISTDVPGSGASRLQLTSDADGMWRVKVIARPEFDVTPPAALADPTVVAVDGSTATLSFVAPGDDGAIGKVMGYDVRLRAGDAMTPENFATSSPAPVSITPDDAGQVQLVSLEKLLPSTQYYLGIQAYDDCHNTSPLVIIPFLTSERINGQVDACFVATAAYGSLMANDVELLRHFRDSMLSSTVLGELAVETYYTFGPAVAHVVGESELLRATARAVLAPVVAVVRRLAF
jgi:hypothetical protein